MVACCSCETFFCANHIFNLLRNDIQSDKVDCSKGITLCNPPQKRQNNYTSVSSLMHLHIQLSIITSEIYAPGQIIQKHKNLHTALTVYN